MKKILFIICGLSCFNALALNVTPLCTDVSSTNKSRIYNNYSSTGQVFYTNGMSQKFFYLSLGECISGEEPGVYKTTLILKQDGNLINYVYDEQNDITHIAFASNTQSQGVKTAGFYLDSSTNTWTHSPMLELLDSNYAVVEQIVPLPSTYSDETLQGSSVLASIIYPNVVYGLTMYDKTTSLLYNYEYNPHPVNYVDVYFDKHTIETRDAHYLITIYDSQNNATPVVASCQLPLTSSDCYGKVKYIQPNHYIVYLEDLMTVEITKLLKNSKNKRSIYFDRLGGIYFSWNDTDQYIIPFINQYPLSNQKTYTWTPSRDNSSTLHILSWDDNPIIPDGDYKIPCEMDTITFASGILAGICLYVDDFGPHYIYSSLNYDVECKKDPTENDLVTTHYGVLACQ